MSESGGASVPSDGLRGASVGWVNGEPVWSSVDGRCWPMDECDANDDDVLAVDWTQVRVDPTPVPADFVALQERLQDGGGVAQEA